MKFRGQITGLIEEETGATLKTCPLSMRLPRSNAT